MMGPYNENLVKTEVEVLEPDNVCFKIAMEQLKAAGVRTVFGRWLIDGYPQVSGRVLAFLS